MLLVKILANHSTGDQNIVIHSKTYIILYTFVVVSLVLFIGGEDVHNARDEFH